MIFYPFFLIKAHRFLFHAVLLFLFLGWIIEKTFPQPPQKIEIIQDSLKITASERLTGRVDTADLRLIGKAIAGKVIKGDTARHGWLTRFGPIELRFEESYPSFPTISFFRFFTPSLVVSPGNLVGIDRKKERAYIIYQSGARDDLDDMTGDQEIKVSSDTAALEYFIEALEIRGFFPAVILDRVSELRQFARYQEQAMHLQPEKQPPVSRIYRHLWKDRSFAHFKRGKLKEKEKDYMEREKAWDDLIRAPSVSLYKDIYNVVLFFARTKDLLRVYKISGFVFQNGAVHYSVIPVKL